MATRLNCTALRDCPAIEVRAVMSEVLRFVCAADNCVPVGDQLDIHEHQGWVWFLTSVWGVSAIDLNRGLCKLARPALQFTTSDGDRWYLTIHGGPLGPVSFVHEFGYHSHDPDPSDDDERRMQLDDRDPLPEIDPRVAFLEDDPSAESIRPRAPFDLAADGLIEMGAVIPDEFRAAVAELPYSAALKRYRVWHAEQLSSALTAAGIPHDPAAVRAVLLWQNVTDNESDGDLGNLPRLLSVLGLGGNWDEFVHQAESPLVVPEPMVESAASTQTEDDVAPESQAEVEDPITSVLSLFESIELTAVTGGGHAVPLDDLTLTRYFVDALSLTDTAGVVLTVRLPADTLIPKSPDVDGATVIRTADGFQVGLSNHLWFSQSDLKTYLGNKLSRLLYHLPDDSELNVAFGLADAPAMTQRYHGIVERDKWRITHSFPPLHRETLSEAFELARYALGDPERHELRDEVEAAAVVARAGRDPQLLDSQIQQDGRTVTYEFDVVGLLPKVIFRQRFADAWNVAAFDTQAAELCRQYWERHRTLRRAGAEAARQCAAPHDDPVLLRGKCGPFWRSDFARFDRLEQETREKIDASAAELGFLHIGDLVSKKQRDLMFRIYVGRDSHSYGMLMAKRTMYLGFEFFSRFADGSRMTSTTNGAVDGRPEFKVYRKAHPGLELPALYEKHRGAIDRFQSRKSTLPVSLSATLFGAALEMDGTLARQAGIGVRIRIVSPPPGEAPRKIRAAWVGCTLPIQPVPNDSQAEITFKGVLSEEPVDDEPGFFVRVVDAVGALEQHDPQAAQWWHSHTPHLIQPGQLLHFRSSCCEVLDESEPLQ